MGKAVYNASDNLGPGSRELARALAALEAMLVEFLEGL